ncbi:hypothetical protein SCMU_00320 [Sinomonas cyclohexanicum]|uniref:TIR domain-containing protein n=1 Tax=Sinomonas cyclohexanicum TaxID=322009 RepID=A0ABM7PPR7_SINCY|nr:toll/interleukin-1 receptor domain-containing protein [Corynebacterium cyclohexanicum]BCT74190.1 hypothetical protein SCMU_00320 [Corynebacterium cyclohexanicum]
MPQQRQSGSFFISFASHDHAIAAELAGRLQEQGLLAFFAPRDIGAGENFALRIVQAIVECETVVVLLSASAISSPHVRREVSLAIDERRRLVPVSLGGIRFPQDFTTEWSYWLSAVQVLGFTTVDDLVGVLAVGHVPDLDRPHFDPGNRLLEPGLPEPSTSTPDAISPVSLLRPEHSIVPFAGREDEIARLSSWLDRKERLSIRLLTAPGGHGKSRLAQELMAKAEGTGWDAAFVRDFASVAFRHVSKPSLWVVDYAETKGPELAEMIQQLSRVRLNVPVRILLLARSAGDWWRTLGSSSAEVETVLTEAVVQELAPLTRDPATASDLYRAAVSSFADALGVRIPDVGMPTEESDSIVDLLQRALLAVLSDSQSEDSERVIQRLLGHERRYVRVAAAAGGLEHFDDVDFDRMAALFSLFPPRGV